MRKCIVEDTKSVHLRVKVQSQSVIFGVKILSCIGLLPTQQVASLKGFTEQRKD